MAVCGACVSVSVLVFESACLWPCECGWVRVGAKKEDFNAQRLRAALCSVFCSLARATTAPATFLTSLWRPFTSSIICTTFTKSTSVSSPYSLATLQSCTFLYAVNHLWNQFCQLLTLRSCPPRVLWNCAFGQALGVPDLVHQALENHTAFDFKFSHDAVLIHPLLDIHALFLWVASTLVVVQRGPLCLSRSWRQVLADFAMLAPCLLKHLRWLYVCETKSSPISCSSHVRNSTCSGMSLPTPLLRGLFASVSLSIHRCAVETPYLFRYCSLAIHPTSVVDVSRVSAEAQSTTFTRTLQPQGLYVCHAATLVFRIATHAVVCPLLQFRLSDLVAQPMEDTRAGAHESSRVPTGRFCKCTFGSCDCDDSGTTTRQDTGVKLANDRADGNNRLRSGMDFRREGMCCKRPRSARAICERPRTKIL